MASKYSTRLFAELPDSPPDRSTGLSFDGGIPRPILRIDIADVAEMAARRHLIGTVLEDLDSDTMAEYKIAASTKAVAGRFLGFSAVSPDPETTPRFDHSLGSASFAVSVPDEDDAPALYMPPPSVEIPLPGGLAELYGQVMYRTELVMMWPLSVFESGAFLDPDWSLPSEWGAAGSGESTYKRGGDYHEVDGSYEWSMTRMIPPTQTLFYSVNDAVYARPLRSGTYQWTDPENGPQTATVHVPPYSTWYDPEGTEYRHAVAGVQVREWGKYCGGCDALHTDGSLLFPYHDTYSQDFSGTDTPNAYRLRERLRYIGPESVVSTAVFLGTSLVPPLRTSTSWWEEHNLGVDSGGAALRGLRPGPIASAVGAMFVPPAVTPHLRSIPSDGMPPEDGYRSDVEGSRGSFYAGFVPRTVHSASMAHAVEIMKPLHRVVLKVPKLRVTFHSEYITRTVSTRTDFTSDSTDHEETTTTDRTTSVDRCRGWIECSAGGYSDLSYANFNGFNLYLEGRSTAEQPPMEMIENYHWADSFHRHSERTTKSRQLTCILDSITPVRDSGRDAYKYTEDVGNSYDGSDPPTTTYTREDNADQAPIPLVPDELLPLIESAELILVADVETTQYGREQGDARRNCTFSGDLASSVTGVQYSGEIKGTHTARVERKAVSLGTSKTLDFGRLDLLKLLDQLAPPVEGGPRYLTSVPGTGLGSVSRGGTFIRNWSNPRIDSYHHDVCQDYADQLDALPHAERQIRNPALFLVIDFDPDRDGVDIWSAGPCIRAVKDAYDAMTAAQLALTDAESAKTAAEDAKELADAAEQNARDALAELLAGGESAWTDEHAEDIAEKEQALAEKEQALADAEQEKSDAESALAAAESAYASAYSAYQALPEEDRPGSAAEADLAAAQTALDAAKSSTADARSAWEEALQDKRAAEAALDAAREEAAAGYAAAVADAESLVAEREGETADAESALDDAVAAYDAAAQALAEAEAAYAAAVEASRECSGGWDPAAD